jgi:hypothetical protein
LLCGGLNLWAQKVLEWRMTSRVRFTKVVVIQSLEPHECQTGRQIDSHIKQLITKHGLQIPVEFLRCKSVVDFRQAIQKLTTEAHELNFAPLLHVECHGGQDVGLEFENSSAISWVDLAALISDLNLASRFNLIAIFSACFGAHFLGNMGISSGAPCYCLIAPTHTIYPDEIYAAFKVLYENIFTTSDLSNAISAISQMSLSEGDWFCMTAEVWFKKVIIGYVKNHCTIAATNKRAKKY